MRTIADDLAEGEPHPVNRAMHDASLPLAERFDLLAQSHPAAFCRRDRLAIQAALEAIDALTARVAHLEERP